MGIWTQGKLIIASDMPRLCFNTFAIMHHILNLQGIIIFGSFGLQLLFQAAQLFITKVCNFDTISFNLS